jgi:hypothetical protein
MGHRISYDIEPLTAAVTVAPALMVHALGVVTIEEIVGPLDVTRIGSRAVDMRLSAITIFSFIA